MVTVTKLFEFEACHHLPNYDGACHNLHGHSYKLSVTIGGTPDKNTGMVLDFKKLKSIVKEVAVDKYDHSNLNDYFENPTAEIMVREIACDIIKKLPKETYLVSCKLWETSTSYAEFNPMLDNMMDRIGLLERMLKYADNETLRPAT